MLKYTESWDGSSWTEVAELSRLLIKESYATEGGASNTSQLVWWLWWTWRVKQDNANFEMEQHHGLKLQI